MTEEGEREARSGECVEFHGVRVAVAEILERSPLQRKQPALTLNSVVTRALASYLARQ